MPDADRSAYLDALKKAFQAEAILYATGSRLPLNLFGGQLANDVLPFLGEHLDRIGITDSILLVLQTQGGNLDTPWPFVNMLRSHAKKLYVGVPEFALSGGTLIALGADRVFMLPHAFLSPVDPTGTWTSEGQTRNIQVEDVIGFVDFLTERVGIRDQSALVQAIKDLVQEVKPIALGSVHRTRALIERLSTNLLELHLTKTQDRRRVAQVVDFLTHSLFTHQHMIPREEARVAIGLGEMIQNPNAEQEEALRAAHREILRRLKCREPFDPEMLLRKGKAEGEERTVEIEADRAILISRNCSHAVRAKYRITQGKEGPIQVKPIGIADWQEVD